ncbi:MAG: glycogen/starch/alpha-glucan family phosphorylase [Lachnospiraceae bacterium]|nr:glycogen/starch/alpha-glucan family phosphorylase [Lachnospiraceae bacterium]
MLKDLFARLKGKTKDEKDLESKINEVLKELYNTNLDDATNEDVTAALLIYTRALMEDMPEVSGDKKVYYISAEFLIGKLLSNNLINLGLYDEVNDVLKSHGKSMLAVEECESEPSLGNGGLGRLAACFLDSIATLELPGDGIGLNYHLGLFKQEFADKLQKEVKNPWIDKENWLVKRGESFDVTFGKCSVKSVLYDVAVPGYKTGSINKLHLFDVDSVDENIVGEGSIDFDKNDIAKNLTLFLYPDDSDREGQLLRIYQQYFMVSSGAQYILSDCKAKGYDLHKLYDHMVIQINDTHPSMVIPELIRLLQLEGIDMDEAIEIVRQTCAYTNHTILAEALEKWPMDYLEEVVPHLIPIIKELDNRIKQSVDDASTYIIDEGGRVHMAHMDIHYGFSINGVAALHTEILKNTELNNFYKLYPEKFNNKTNGITFRRWLLHCNPELSNLLSEKIGDGYKHDAMKLENFKKFENDDDTLRRLEEIKHYQKVELTAFMKNRQGIEIDPDSIFDVQVKRLHEYKRQQMNILYAVYKYLEIKNGNKPKTSITMIFGAKAAPAYIIAKDIIHFILCMQEIVANDPEVSPYFRVVMAENYNVEYASKIIPAAEISEQISLASKEASGTSNMKFMLNGAITLGTEDGANVEIKDLVGDDNIYIFGKKSDEVIKLYKDGSYNSYKIYEEDELIHRLVDFIISDQVMSIGQRENLERLHHEIISKDWFMTLLDLREYIDVKEKIYADYEDRKRWNQMAVVNISKAGFFSSDRTIAEYNKDIWKLN